MAKIRKVKSPNSISLNVPTTTAVRLGRKKGANENLASKPSENILRLKRCVVKLHRYKMNELSRTVPSDDKRIDKTNKKTSNVATNKTRKNAKTNKGLIGRHVNGNDEEKSHCKPPVQEHQPKIDAITLRKPTKHNSANAEEEEIRTKLKTSNMFQKRDKYLRLQKSVTENIKLRNCAVLPKRYSKNKIAGFQKMNKRTRKGEDTNGDKKKEETADKSFALRRHDVPKSNDSKAVMPNNCYNNNNNDDDDSFNGTLKTSTPYKLAIPLRREPFREINLDVRSLHYCAKEPHITKENRENFKKLSLSLIKIQKKQNNTRNQSAEKSRNIEISAESNSNQSPMLLECNSQYDGGGSIKDITERSTTNVAVKDISSHSQNFANKTNLIEDVLFEEDYNGTVDQPLSQPPTKHKFFHRNVKENNENTTKLNSKKSKFSKEISSSKRKTSPENVYDFFSQSQTSDLNNSAAQKCDPAADIIQKLIAEGKVRVATLRKGTGKPGVKPKNVARKGVQRKQKTLKNNKTSQKVKKKIDKALDKNVLEIDQIHDVNNDVNDVETVQHPKEQRRQLLKDTSRASSSSASSPHHVHDTSSASAFSSLARSVLIREANKDQKQQQQQQKRKRITDQHKLLEAARKFVSTPLNKNPSHLDKITEISPSVNRREISIGAGNASPWRVNDDTHLPNVFYFSRNTDNLPSFSSDYIPSTPKKQSPRYQDFLPPSLSPPLSPSTAPPPPLSSPQPPPLTSPQPPPLTSPQPPPLISSQTPPSSLQPLSSSPQLHSPTVTATATNNETARTRSPLPSPNAHDQSSPPSFASNDSNAENMPPPPLTSPSQITVIRDDANEEAINKRQQLNPLRNLDNRDPLKAIHILEVVSLPSWKPSERNADHCDGGNIASNTTTVPTTLHKERVDLFGFEEFIENDDDDYNEKQQQQQQQMQNEASDKCDVSIRQRLQRLRQLRPENTEIQTLPSKSRIKPVFDDGGGGKQLNIKEMLCSTMITNNSNDNQLKQKDDICKEKISMESGTNELFTDPEPELSFNEKAPRRTYSRPYKRKRKLRHNFVMFLDSDESGEDAESAEKEGAQKAEHKIKKHRTNVKDNKELNSFVEGFNEMCKEVDQYELLVE